MQHLIRRCGFLFLALAFAVHSAMAAESAPLFAILHTNDVHGRFDESEKSIGHDRVAAIFRETRRRVPATILLDAGDAVQGNALVKWNKGAAAVEIMNAAGYDGMALGNHEFDYGWDAIVELARLADFPFFTQPVVSEGVRGFEAAAVYERGGRRIGVFGLTTPETAQSSAGGFGRTFGEADELVAYADAMAASLRRAGAEIVVCLAHLGVNDNGFLTSYGLRDRVTGVDVIIDGHSHTPLSDIVQVEGKALVASAGEHCESLGLVEFHCKDGRLRPVARSIAREEALAVSPDPAVTDAIGKWTAEAKALGGKALVKLPAPLDANRQLVRTRETAVGNALADAMRSASGSDVALVNGGNIRASLPAGDVTAAHLDAILPYDNTVLTAKIAGGTIREALELSVSRYPGEFGGFLQVSGLRFAFDPEKPAGKRVTRVEIGGKPLADDGVYSVSVCDWLASGGDGYEMLVKPFKNERDGKIFALVDVFIHYLNRIGETPPAAGDRIAVDAAGNTGTP